MILKVNKRPARLLSCPLHPISQKTRESADKALLTSFHVVGNLFESHIDK